MGCIFMAKYTVEQKLEILDAWKKQEISRAAIARKYGVAAQMIRQWEKQYELRGEDGLIPRDNIRNRYTGEFRVQVAEEILKGELSLHEIGQKYDLNRALLLHWKKLYLAQSPDYLAKDHRGRKSTAIVHADTAPTNMNDLKKEYERLRAEVAYLKKLNALVQERELREKKHK